MNLAQLIRILYNTYNLKTYHNTNHLSTKRNDIDIIILMPNIILSGFYVYF